MNPKSILFVGMYPNCINKYRNVFFRNLIYAIADQGIKCTVISPVPLTRYKADTFKIKYHTVDITEKGSEIDVYYPKYISASSKKIGSWNTERLSERLFQQAAVNAAKRLNNAFDCVYGHFFLYGGLAAIKVGQLLGIPSFFAYGECDFESQVGNTYGMPNRKELNGLRGIISVSQKNTRELKSLGIVDDIPIITAPNSVDLSLFYKRPQKQCRQKFGLPEDNFIVGFVGGFIERKGDKRLLEAVKRIDGAYLAFAGRGDNPPSGDKVLFCGALEHEQVAEFLNAVDVFCLPTRSEGSCNAIVEAAASGLPIISSDLPFNDDLLNNENSVRIDPDSVDEIENAVRQMMDEKFRKEKAEKVFADAQNFGIDRRAGNILKFLYDNMK